MLANNDKNRVYVGAFNIDTHQPATFLHQLLNFIAKQLPKWRDDPDRPKKTNNETDLTSHLSIYLSEVARHSDGMDNLHFTTERTDETERVRKIDLAPATFATIVIEGRTYTKYDILLPIECKRLPAPIDPERDVREYVISEKKTAGGIQRFKAGHHGAYHKIAAMIGYIQVDNTSIWDARVKTWISDLAKNENAPDWTLDDLLTHNYTDDEEKIAVFQSLHKRKKGLSEIEIRHFWLEMN